MTQALVILGKMEDVAGVKSKISSLALDSRY